MKRAVRERLAELSAEWGLPKRADERLAALLAEVAAEPASISTVRDPSDAVGRHVEDSLTGLLAPELRGARSVADLGSGGGFPGLVMAIARPEAEVFLVESVRRKCEFLERAAAAAAIGNVHVVCERAEAWRQGAASCEAVTARALAPLPVLVEYAAPLLAIGGTLVCWKAAPEAIEVAAGRTAAALIGLEPEPDVLVSREPRRVLVRYRKVAPTPPRFPRRPGVARKRPLA